MDKVKYRLGIDIGTASLGLVAYEIELQKDEDGSEIYVPTKLLHMDTVIFREPLNPKNHTLLNAKRRKQRSHRRLLDRSKRQKRKIFYLANQVAKVTEEDYQAVKGDDIFRLRSKAVEEKITLPELFRVFSHLSKNRGYKGDLKSSGTVGKGIEETKKALEKYEVETLGQLYYKLQQENKDTSNKWRILTKSKDANATYATRDMIEKEFKLIIEKQAEFHEILNKNFEEIGGDLKYFLYTDPKDLKNEDNLTAKLLKAKEEIVSFKDAIYKTIFYQRPIYWDKDTIKKCELTGEYVASKASLTFQKWRIETRLNNLRWKVVGEKEKPIALSEEEKAILREELNKIDNLKFVDIYQALNVSEKKLTDDRTAKSGEDKGIKGNVTLTFFNDPKRLKDENFKKATELFNKFSFEEQEGALQYFSMLSSTDELYQDEDYIKDSLKDFCNIQDEKNQENILEFLKYFREYKDIKLFGQMGLDEGRTQYSISAMNKLLPHIINGIIEADAIKAEFPNLNKEKSFEEIVKDITNPIVSRSLRELKRVLDYTYHKLGGKPYQVIVELTREMKTPPKERAKLESMNRKQEEERKKYAKELQKDSLFVNSSNIEKLILLKEQGNKCAYSGELSKLEDLEIEHIIPKTKGGGNARYNKVVVCRSINNNKGNYTPYQASKNNHDVKWGVIEALAEEYQKKGSNNEEKKYFKRKAKLLLHQGDPEDIDENFMERANTETAFIGRVLTNWLQQDVKEAKNGMETVGEGDVIVSRGKLTAHLRRIWGLDNLLPEIRYTEKKPLIASVENKPQFLDYHLWKEFKQTNNQEEAKEFLEKHNKKLDKELIFYKRSDHRHHIIDAAIIGLTTRSLLQKASTIFAKTKKGTLKKVLDKKTGEIISEGFYPKKPLVNLKEILREKLTNYVVWTKPDRHINMDLFQETAYSLKKDDDFPSGEKRIIKSKALNDFVDKDLKKVIIEMEDIIVGKDIKSSIIQQFKDRYEKIKSDNEKLAPIDKIKKEEDLIRIALTGKQDDIEDGIFFPEHLKKNKVKKVKCYYKKNGVVTYKPNKDLYQEKNNAVYLNNGYSLVKVSGKNAEPLTHFQAAKLDKSQLKESEDFRYIYPNDIVFYNNKFYIVKQFNVAAGVALVQNTEPFSFATYKDNIDKTIRENIKKNEAKLDYYQELKDNSVFKWVGWKDVYNIQVMQTREDIVKMKKQCQSK